jgi:hypothetical protein
MHFECDELWVKQHLRTGSGRRKISTRPTTSNQSYFSYEPCKRWVYQQHIFTIFINYAFNKLSECRGEADESSSRGLSWDHQVLSSINNVTCMFCGMFVSTKCGQSTNINANNNLATEFLVCCCPLGSHFQIPPSAMLPHPSPPHR